MTPTPNPNPRGRAASPARPIPLAPPPAPESLPHPITIFASARERGAILRALKRLDPDRRAALCKALGISPDTRAERPAPSTQPSTVQREPSRP